MAGKLNVPAMTYSADVGCAEAEYISPKGWVGQCSAAHGPGMIFVCTWHTPWPDRFTHIRNSLGYSQRNGGKLNRKLPRVHPHASWLRATRLVSMEGVHWIGKSGGPAGMASDYDIARLTYTFEQLPYDLKEDGATKAEYERFVIKNQKPSAELFSREGFNWKYVEGPQNKEDFPGKVGVVLTKVRLAWKWVQVPERYLMSGGVPTRLVGGLNTINSLAFAGYEAETLMLESYDLEARSEPVPPTGFDASALERTFDVTLYMTRFKPPIGGAKEGWNNDPGADMRWYQTRAFKGGNDSGNAKFVTYDFAQLFQAA